MIWNHYFGPRRLQNKFRFIEDFPQIETGIAEVSHNLFLCALNGQETKVPLGRLERRLLSAFVDAAPGGYGQLGRTVTHAWIIKRLMDEAANDDGADRKGSVYKAVAKLQKVFGSTAIKNEKGLGYAFCWPVKSEQFAEDRRGSRETDGTPKFVTNMLQGRLDFIGRKREVADVIDHLRNGRMVNIWSGGGRGKSELAFAVARKLQRDDDGLCFDGQLYVDLQGYRSLEPLTSDEAMRAILNCVTGIEQRHGTLSAKQLTVEARRLLGNKRILLVADNARHLGQLSQFFEIGLPLTILVTSRSVIEARRIDVNYELAAMSFEDSIELLEKRSKYRNLKVLDSVAKLCRSNPLALNLAAKGLARFKGRENEYVSLLKGNVLEAVSPDEPEDEMLQLTSVIRVSYELLKPELQAKWRRLAVFPGSFSVAALRAFWVEDSVNVALDLRKMERNFALINLWRISTVPSETRYILHDCSRDYALAVSQVEPRHQRDRLYHANYFADLYIARAGIIEQDAQAAKTFFDTELENLEEAHDVLMTGSTVESAQRYCEVYLKWRVFIDRMSPEARDIWTAPAPRLARLLPMNVMDLLLLRASMLARRGGVLAFQGKFRWSYARFRMAKALLGRISPHSHGHVALQRDELDEQIEWEIGWHWKNVQNEPRAASVFEPLVPRLENGRRNNKRFKLLLATRDALAGTYLTLGQPQKAEPLLIGTLDRIRRSQFEVDIWSLISAVTVTGCLLADVSILGTPRPAMGEIGVELCKLAHKICETHKRPWGLAVLSQRIGDLYLRIGHPIAAREWTKRAEGLAREWELTVSISEALSGQERALALLRHEASIPVNGSVDAESGSRAVVGEVLQAVGLALRIDAKKEEYLLSNELLQMHQE